MQAKQEPKQQPEQVKTEPEQTKVEAEPEKTKVIAEPEQTKAEAGPEQTKVEAEPVQPKTEAKPMNTCKKEEMVSSHEDLEDSQIPLSFDETFASDMLTYAFGNLQTVFAQTV